MVFINTRPPLRANPLMAYLQEKNIEVLELPLLELLPCELSEQEKHCLNQIHDSSFYQGIVLVSQTAVRYFFNFLQDHQVNVSQNTSLRFIAVGQKTAQTFQKYGQKITDIPLNVITPSQYDLSENNEGLLQLPFIESLKKCDKILIIKGKEGRQLFKDTLLAKNVQVDEVNFYQRVFPLDSERIFKEFCQHYRTSQNFSDRPIVLITSLTAWQHWQELCKKYGIASQQFLYLTLQQRLFSELSACLPAQNLVQIDNLTPQTVLAGIAKFSHV